MTRTTLSPRDLRALRAGLWVVLPALVLAGAVLPYVRARTARVERIAAERSLLARELRLLGESKGFLARFGDAEKVLLAEAPRLFGGEDVSLAANDLTTYVATRALEHRVFVQSQDARPADSVSAGLQPLELELQVASDLTGVLGLVHDLEDDPKLVRVQRLVIGRAESSGGAVDEGAIWARITLRGYALVPVQPKTPTAVSVR
jgi:hypothetical protein